MSRVAIFTDSASDLDPAEAAARGSTIVPLLVTFGAGDVQGRRRPVDRGVLGADGRPGRAVPDDRGLVARRLQGRLRGGLRGRRRGDRLGPRRRAPCRARSRAPRSPGTCCPTARSTSSIRSAPRWPRGSSRGWRVELAAEGRSAAEIAEMLEARAPRHAHVRRPRDARVPQEGRPDQRRPGGHRDAALGQADHRASTHGVVETVDRVRTRSKARERVIELICERPIERLAILHTITPGRRGVPRRGRGAARRAPASSDVTIDLVGASVGPHLGPGCVGAAVLYRA